MQRRQQAWVGELSPAPQVLSGNLAYVIYTSGTTGRPKGVMIEHRGMANLKVFFETGFKVGKTDRVLQFAKLSFDASVSEIFMALWSGAPLYLMPEEIIGNYSDFEKFIEKHQITAATLPPPYLGYLNPGNINSLKILVTAGSETTPALVEMWRRKLEYINAYGPTEATICATCWHAPVGSGGVDYRSVPIGAPILNTGVYILASNNGNQVQPVGVPGELCIGGDGLARGYLNNPELTAEKFIDFHHSSFDLPRIHHSKLYRTGDLARWLPDGNIEFLGRIDHQVKIRGFRIELGEIENRLVNHPEIKEAVVTAKTDESGDKYLCAYIVSGEELGIPELREYLAKDLPDYMIPAYFMRLDEMPLSLSGKIDRKALPQPGLEKTGNYTAPRDGIEQKLLTLWLEILGKDRLIGIDDNFFEVGGHSLRATMLTSRIQKELNVKVPLAEVFKSPTIEALARYIRAAVKETYIAVEPAEKKEYYPLSSAQGRFYILQEVTPESTAYNMTAFINKEA
jgi:fengycin family lipopeptide synthetase D